MAGGQGTGIHILIIILSMLHCSHTGYSVGLGLEENSLIYTSLYFPSLQGKKAVQVCVHVCVCTHMCVHIPGKKLNRLYDNIPKIMVIYDGKKIPAK